MCPPRRHAVFVAVRVCGALASVSAVVPASYYRAISGGCAVFWAVYVGTVTNHDFEMSLFHRHPAFSSANRDVV
ncbi:hypothetical protein SCLCIDRAFT_1220629 [Scleroderma citrinum Foug A]|uniref:Uncharacterized protein n=1 Tax=Scleroderma citrinum Foug A TaxID=1036808 RepID=A0A0C3DHZ2_9AGAM|nr:hypothetical protein SCLCIDRAFT_1220629 [Scleroderma citrinum Foug A]